MGLREVGKWAGGGSAHERVSAKGRCRSTACHRGSEQVSNAIEENGVKVFGRGGGGAEAMSAARLGTTFA